MADMRVKFNEGIGDALDRIATLHVDCKVFGSHFDRIVTNAEGRDYRVKITVDAWPMDAPPRSGRYRWENE